MIVVQTPLRVSFLGGGTDFEDFYKEHGGAVLTTAINKCVYVVVQRRYDNKIYLNYSKKEIVDKVEDIQHELVREAMKITGVTKGVEITTLADIPAAGTGLGSSSSVTVGLLHALYAYQGVLVTAEELARLACEIEINRLKSPIGRQDQYIAAYGGTRLITFAKGAVLHRGVEVEPIKISEEELTRFNASFLLLFTGLVRQAATVLTDQKANIPDTTAALSQLRDLAYAGKLLLLDGSYDQLGKSIGVSWSLKKQLSNKITLAEIDEMYQTALNHGALGGKILGAGAGGFLLLYVPKEKRDSVKEALRNYDELPIRFGESGSKVIFDYKRE